MCGIADFGAGPLQIAPQLGPTPHRCQKREQRQGDDQGPILCFGQRGVANPLPAGGISQGGQFIEQFDKPGASDRQIAGNPQQIFIEQPRVVRPDLSEPFLAQVQLAQAIDERQIAPAQLLEQILLAVQQ